MANDKTPAQKIGLPPKPLRETISGANEKWEMENAPVQDLSIGIIRQLDNQRP